MFKPYEILLNTPEMSIEVIADKVEIKAGKDFVTCAPAEVMDSPGRISFEEMKNRLAGMGENPADWIKNWYLKAVNER